MIIIIHVYIYIYIYIYAERQPEWFRYDQKLEDGS